jgi:hypothetical protein
VVDQPLLQDIGRLAVLIAGRPVALYLNHGERDPARLMTARELRDVARERPADPTGAHMAAGVRMLAWIVIGVTSFVGSIVVSLVPSLGPLLDLVVSAVLVVLICSFLFASMSFLVHIGRITLIQIVGAWGFAQEGSRGKSQGRGRSRKGASPPEPGNRFARWLCTPNWFDAVPALLWTLLFAPSLIGIATSS